MSEDWQDKLRKLHEELLKDPQSKGTPRSSRGANGATATPTIGTGRAQISRTPAVDAILGIDFGTRFTKVAVFLPHINQRLVLALGAQKTRVLPSRLVFGDDGRLYPVTCGTRTKPRLVIEYLKNRLADPAAEAFGASFAVAGLPLSKIIKPACALYLAEILRKAEIAARAAFPVELSIDRRINWFANVGVPTKHYDSEILSVFREVSAVAWIWRTKNIDAPLPAEIVTDYDKTARTVNPTDMPIQVAPELTAALVHFAEHRNTAAGAYSFFDIGGGTLDGSVFRLRREKDGSSFDILSANVEELGTMAIARHVLAHAYKSMATEIERPIIFGGVSPEAKFGMPKQIEERIQTFFASVIGQAHKRGLFPPSSQFSGRRLNEPTKPTLPVFIAGGGCRSEWYQNLFSRTCNEYGHSAQWGIAGYDVKIVPPPGGTLDDEYPRFVIALGLTSGNLHFNQYRLPSRYSTVPALPSRELSAPNYEDTKDLT